MNVERIERMKALSKSVLSAARKADKAIIAYAAKTEWASRRSSSAEKRRAELDAEMELGTALAALDECSALSERAIAARRS